ncbi:13784_t:CDS:2 [Funneliformis geosporum]|nr:13784_t:CDS:2 [Funneliformis geosporum]
MSYPFGKMRKFKKFYTKEKVNNVLSLPVPEDNKVKNTIEIEDDDDKLIHQLAK